MGKKTKILLSTVIGLLVLVVVVSVQTASFGEELSRLERERVKLIQERTYLQEQLSKSTSLTNAGRKAEKLEFTSETQVVYVGNDTEAFANLPSF